MHAFKHNAGGFGTPRTLASDAENERRSNITAHRYRNPFKNGRSRGRGPLRSPLAEDQIHSRNYGGGRDKEHHKAKQRPLPPRQFHTHPLQTSIYLIQCKVNPRLDSCSPMIGEVAGNHPYSLEEHAHVP
jgi:hypothetical protein